MKRFISKLPWYWLIAGLGGSGFAFYLSGSAEEYPAANITSGLLLFVFIALILAKLLIKPRA